MEIPTYVINAKPFCPSGLDSGGVNYTICIMLETEADVIIANETLDRVDHMLYPDCVSITTKSSLLWEYQLAFYIISGFMLVTVVGLIILRLICDRFQGSNMQPFEKDVDYDNEAMNKDADMGSIIATEAHHEDIPEVRTISSRTPSGENGHVTLSGSLRRSNSHNADPGSPSRQPLTATDSPVHASTSHHPPTSHDHPHLSHDLSHDQDRSHDQTQASQDHQQVKSTPVCSSKRNKPAFETESMDDFLLSSSNEDSPPAVAKQSSSPPLLVKQSSRAAHPAADYGGDDPPPDY
jgi:hypothetical protein